MPSHRINLRGPWDYRWLNGAAQPISAQGTVAMPCEWRNVFGLVCGTAEFRRKFHKPTNLESHESVVIVLTEVGGQGKASLNGVSLGEFSSAGDLVEFEITNSLSPFNELMIEVAFDPSADEDLKGGLYGVTALEIRSGSLE